MFIHLFKCNLVGVGILIGGGGLVHYWPGMVSVSVQVYQGPSLRTLVLGVGSDWGVCLGMPLEVSWEKNHSLLRALLRG